jgi:L-gulonate 5-dehydrogenase
MKAIRAFGPHDVQMVELPMPEITNPTDVRIKVKAGGVCGSDIHVWHGTNIYAVYPLNLGHEISGVVESAGAEIEDLKPGDKVVLEPFQCCGKCYACGRGRPNVCHSLQVYGAHIDGGFCEYLVSPRKNFHKVPDSLSFEQAAMIEPYTIAAQCVWRADVRAGDMVLIHGAGPLGLIVADTVSRMGATVIVSEVNENRLQSAKIFGASHLINPKEQNFNQEIMKITDGMGPNVIFEATGVPALLSESMPLASVAGRIVPLAFGAQPIPIAFSEINKKELTILGSRHQTFKFKPVIENFARHSDKIEQLITGVYAADDFMRAFEAFTEADTKHRKVVLRF